MVVSIPPPNAMQLVSMTHQVLLRASRCKVAWSSFYSQKAFKKGILTSPHQNLTVPWLNLSSFLNADKDSKMLNIPALKSEWSQSSYQFHKTLLCRTLTSLWVKWQIILLTYAKLLKDTILCIFTLRVNSTDLYGIYLWLNMHRFAQLECFLKKTHLFLKIHSLWPLSIRLKKYSTWIILSTCSQQLQIIFIIHTHTH